MGYSIATPCKSAKAQRVMLGFLLEHYRPWSVVSGQKIDYATGPLEGLSYDRGKCRIGFDHNAFLGEWDYVWSLCRFMALRVGRLRRFDDFEEPVPYIVYDGHDAMPVPDRTLWVRIPRRWTPVHPWGEGTRTSCGDTLKHLQEVPEILPFRRELERHRKLLRDEMKRLAALW